MVGATELPPTSIMRRSLLLLLLTAEWISIGQAFQLSRSRPSRLLSTQTTTATTVAAAAASDEPLDFDPLLGNGQRLELSLLPHRPLGCTVEESLADGHYIFVSKVVEGGFAADAGLQVGDVIVGVSNLFGDVTSVTGLDQIKGLVASRPEEEALELTVVRGTAVAEEHERVLVDLCTGQDEDEAAVEECVLDYLKGGYADPTTIDDAIVVDDGDEDLVQSLLQMWAQDLPPPPPPAAMEPTSPAVPDPLKKKVKPWSSRSSPSGTYVRDPVTGEMKNIDA